MKFRLYYIPPNWNDYINLERRNKYAANKLKQQEKEIVHMLLNGKEYTGNYPVELILSPHYANKRQDLDNFRAKGIIDGMVDMGIVKNDNLTHIQRITIEPVFDNQECIDIEIKEIEYNTERSNY